jgi:ribosome-binding protein aMBF1 (putative translation factor)
MSIMNKNRQKIVTEAALAHRETLRKNLQHRIEVARAQGNEKLVRQLEAEATYLNLN